MKQRTGFSVPGVRVYAITTLIATMLVIPGVGSTDAATPGIERLFGDATQASQQAVIYGADGQPQGSIDLSLQGGIANEGDSLQAVLTVSGWPDPFSAVLFTSGKGGDFSDGGEHPTATGDVDYLESRRSFFIDAPGPYVLPISTFDDAEVEGSEWFMVIAGPQGAFPPYSFSLRVRSGIVDNDSNPTLAVDDVTVTEGDAGTTQADFAVTLAPASSATVEVRFSTCGVGCHDDATATNGEDYQSNTGSLTFLPGETSKSIPVTINGDTQIEDDEIFFMSIGDPVNADISDSLGLGTILNDDAATPPALSVDDLTVTEGDGGTVDATFTVSLSPAATSTVSVEYGTCGVGCLPDATAVYSEDYEATSGTLTFNPGQTGRTVTVPVIGDVAVEDDEVFYLLIWDAIGATITDDRGRAVILNDDTQAESVLSINDVTLAEGDTGTTAATFTVTLVPPASSTVTVDYSTCGVGCNDDATAMKGEDYAVSKGTLTFTPGQTSKSIQVTINGDTKVENDEIYFMNLLDPVGATRSRNRGIGTILNDDTGGGVAPMCNGLLATIWGDGLLVGTAGNDIIAGGPGSDEIRGNGGDDVLCGFGGDDTIIGGRGDDQMWGGAGNDLIKGQPGDDTMYGGPGDDRIQGNAGMDIAQGDDGKDRMWGGIGPDLMTGGAGNDQLHGNPGGDGLIGGTGTDRIWGDADDDSILGGEQSDFLYGGIGSDTIEGGPGNDRLFGWHGNDLLYGNEGRDQLRGQDGVDLVDGGPHYDYCSVETTMVSCEQPM
jgi:Ca2+-binding RTX toxin-like protein